MACDYFMTEIFSSFTLMNFSYMIIHWTDDFSWFGLGAQYCPSLPPCCGREGQTTKMALSRKPFGIGHMFI
jgi:hypothetical protein